MVSIIVMLTTFSWQQGPLCNYGITKDQLLCKLSTGALILWLKLNSIHHKWISSRVSLLIDQFAFTILEAIPQSTKFTLRTSLLPFAGILKSLWTLLLVVRTPNAIHLIWENQTTRSWSIRTTLVPSSTSILPRLDENLWHLLSISQSGFSHSTMENLVKFITLKECNK